MKRVYMLALQHMRTLSAISAVILLVLLIDSAYALDYRVYPLFHGFDSAVSENSSVCDSDIIEGVNLEYPLESVTQSFHPFFTFTNSATPIFPDSHATWARAIPDSAEMVDWWDTHSIAIPDAVDSTGPQGYTERTLAGFCAPWLLTPESASGQSQYGSAWMVLMFLLVAAILLVLLTKYTITRRVAVDLEHLVEERTRQLRESSEQYRSLVQNAVVGIFQISPSGQVKTCNPALTNMLRFDHSQDLESLNLRDQVFVDPNQWDIICGMDAETGQIVAVEAEWRRFDGEIATVRLSGRWVELDENELVCELIAEDITALLRARVAEIEAERLRGVQKLAITVAHEFNNPLSILLGTYQLYLQPNLKHFDEDVQERLDKMPKAVSRMRDLVLRLLRITKLRENEYIQGTSFLNLAQSTDEDEIEAVAMTDSKPAIESKPRPVLKSDETIDKSEQVTLSVP
ncbi:sensory histidine kinase AtoS [bacterium BMS3Bbin04]|nr:sensory histidine kinase AtoS [bacterium BMS3Bbin04]